MWLCRNRVCCLVFLVFGCFGKDAVAQQDVLTADVQTVAATFISDHCVDCHAGDGAEAGLDLDSWRVDSGVTPLQHWTRIYDRVADGEMPPDADSIDAESRKAFLNALSKTLLRFEKSQRENQGRTVYRRLNRTEYHYSVRDLLGIETDLESLLPEENSSSGFDTVSSGLRFSQLHLETLLEAANLAVDQALVLTELPEPVDVHIEMKQVEGFRKNLEKEDGAVDPENGETHRRIFRETDDAVLLFASGENLRQFSAPVSGFYKIHLSAYAVNAGQEPVAIQVFAHRWAEKRQVGFYYFQDRTTREVEFEAYLNRDELLQIQPYASDYDDQGRGVWNVGADQYQGRGLAVQWLNIKGPVGSWPPLSTRRLLDGVSLEEIPENQRRWRPEGRLAYRVEPEDPDKALTQVLTRVARRAWRRDVSPEELEPYVQLGSDALKQNRPFIEALSISLKAILVSPQFLVLEENSGKLNGQALANRLSYFLWKSLPDQELRRVAEEGRLANPEVLRQQTDRLLNDPRADRFITSFTAQWLDLQNIDATSPDSNLYPEFDPVLQRSMVLESEAFVRELIRTDAEVKNLIDSDFVVVDRVLALHYKIPGVMSETFQAVKVPEGNPRGGLITQAAVLKVTANGTVTSPVRRGTWVMSRLLGQPPLPPPPNVGSVEPDTRGATTIREQLARHRELESCASCHNDIDPPGFALECFDVIGGFRTNYRSVGEGEPVMETLNNRRIWQYKSGLPVDSSGETADGRSFADVQQYKQLLMAEEEQVTRNLTQNLIAFATGTPVTFSDRATVEKIVTDVQDTDGGVRTLIHAVIQSPLFLNK